MEAGRSDLERRSILVLNKIDLARTTPGVILSERFGEPVYVSAKTGEGMDALRQAIYHKAIGSDHGVPESDVALTNERQKNCVVKGRDSLANALEAVRIGMSEEFIALDIRKATDALGEIIGSVRSEDVLDSIFSTFCIGK
jgi:tRNA modification GTPase